jgi:prepilin-type N-terminal cleavage/methylation domain-containing protein
MIKKGFTLVELLVVVVVIAILMAVSFRMMGVGEEETSRSLTVMRLHALETCISGYFAAFGSYPPVRLHGSRNIYCPLNPQGGQVVNAEPIYRPLEAPRVNEQVRAACRSQPVAMNFPFQAQDEQVIKDISTKMQQRIEKGNGDFFSGAVPAGFDAMGNGWGRLEDKVDEDRWTHLTLFRFGLMSFLLPRYRFMMQGPHTGIYDEFAQWGNNNNIPCRFENGVPYRSWKEIAEQVRPPSTGNGINQERWKVDLLPSQIVTARWIACLEGCCHSQSPNIRKLEVWGVDILAKGVDSDLTEAGLTTKGRYPPIFSSGDVQSEGLASDSGFFEYAYALDGITCRDGWGQDFYYYSPPPYQGYRLWSSGPNTETFPPWITEKEIDEMSGTDSRIAREWKADDLVHTSN